MTATWTIAFACVLTIACDTNQPASDQTFFLRGEVVDSTSGAPLADTFVGFRHPTIPDTLVFVGDSVDVTDPNRLLISKTTDGQGGFEFTFFLGARDTAVYNLLFAYKPGFELWRYDRSPVPITAGAEYVDHIVIPLAAKN